MKTPLRSSVLRSRQERREESDQRIAAIVLAERELLEDIRRGKFRGDAFDAEGNALTSPSPFDDEEFMRSVFPNWPDMSVVAEKPQG